MSTPPPGPHPPYTVPRDGTSQPGRRPEALDPTSAPLDARTLPQLLAYVAELGKRLRWYGEDDRPDGTWDRLLGADGATDEARQRLAAYAQDPALVLPAPAQPHVVLLLAALRLLGLARARLNALPARHLDFYQREVLQLRPRPPEPDRVHVLAAPGAGQPRAWLPQGSLLAAGQDAGGHAQVYATLHDLTLSRVRVAERRSVCAEVRVTDPAAVRRDTKRTPGDTFMDLLRLALGDPAPGDALPPASLTPDPGSTLEIVDSFVTETLAKWLGFACAAPPSNGVYLDFWELRELVALKQRERVSEGQWERINGWLELAGRRRAPGFSFSTFKDFVPADFSRNLARALPDLDCSPPALPAIGSMVLARKDLAGYLSVIERIEAYFHMPAESLRFLIQQAWPALAPPKQEGPEEGLRLWRRTDAILAAARAAKACDQRRKALSAQRKAAIAAGRDGLMALLAAALERPPDQPNLLEDALAQLKAPLDKALLRQAGKSPPTSDEDWRRLESVAERIQRARLGDAAAPPPVKREWIALHAYADATAVVPVRADGRSVPPPSGSPWRTFGMAPDREAYGRPPDPVLGWAISSPVLTLRQGRRCIELSLQFAALDNAQKTAVVKRVGADLESCSTGPFMVEISTADGWAAADKAQLSLREDAPALVGDGPSNEPRNQSGKPSPLTLHLCLGFLPSAPPIAAAPGLGIASPWPALRVMLRPRWDGAIERYRSDYPLLRALTLTGIACKVTVGDPPPDPKDKPTTPPATPDPEAGLTAPLLRNDGGVLDPSKPFEPFGPRPAVGSRLVIADPELAVKRLDALWLDCVWLGVPAQELVTWYDGYAALKNRSNAVFTVQAALVDRCSAYPIGTDQAHTDPVGLFDANDATKPHRLLFAAVDAARPGAPPALDLPPPTDPTRWPRYLRLELTPVDFQGVVYPAEAARRAQETATWWAASPHPAGDPPKPLNPPFVPQLKRLGIGYSACTQWCAADGKGLNSGDALFHIHPFGTGRPQAGADGTIPFLPADDALGALYLGLDGVAAPQRLSLLFALAEGSADPDLPPAPVRWAYLDGDHWVDLDRGQVRRDDTRGLIQSGTVELDLPPAAPPTRLPAGRYWLRLAVDADPRGLCDTVAILTNAVAAQFVDRGNDPAHYHAPLPAGRIEGPVRPIPGLGTLSQPYTSFGGRPAESPAGLATRAAERLRHRRRALTCWDYERLALARFPSLYKVKCLPAGPGDDPADLGLVRVVVIPDLRGRLPCDPFGPKASADRIAEIADYLQGLAATGARIEVRNADFLPVRVRVGIRFKDDCDVAIACAESIERLNRALSPWAFDAQADIAIGGAIYANSLVDILERHPGVRYVRTIHLFRFDAERRRFVHKKPPASNSTDGYCIAALTSHQVLVAAGDHVIDVISRDVDPEQPWEGIGYMKIGIDFEIARTPVKHLDDQP